MFDAHAVMNFFLKGGFFMIPLVVSSLVSLTIILERGWVLRHEAVIPEKLANDIEQLNDAAQLQELTKYVTEADQSSLGRLVGCVLRNTNRTKGDNMEALQVQARHEIIALERGLVILEIIVGIGPLLGLLGTLTGLTEIFGGMGAGGAASQGAQLAQGIAQALNTTVVGLVVAIPSLSFWSYYTRKIEGLAVEMESLCTELIGKLYLGR